ncbi:hypothetical protein [Streptomyces sp. NPDC042319]|uniref:hypothetical protein n=1 Tax=Streptomyces sp. NPDC042319 TaxID=3154332 RepID=UPI0033D9FA72
MPVTIEPSSATVQQGGRIAFITKEQPPNLPVEWEVLGVQDSPVKDRRNPYRAWWNVSPEQSPGDYIVRVVITLKPGQTIGTTDPNDLANAVMAVNEVDVGEITIQVVPAIRPPFSSGDNVQVQMNPAATFPEDDQALWSLIRNSTDRISFEEYDAWLEPIMCNPALLNAALSKIVPPREKPDLAALPFPGVDAYQLLKRATEVFLLAECGVFVSSNKDVIDKLVGRLDLREERERYGERVLPDDPFRQAITNRWRRYISADPKGAAGHNDPAVLPYLGVIQRNLPGVLLRSAHSFGVDTCYGILEDKLRYPFLLEFIWSYWHEEGMLCSSLDAVANRFQNLRGTLGPDPLAQLETDPLRALGQLLWGYVQDEQHRLTAVRRAYEYDHQYGITQLPLGAPALRPADSRPRFLEAFHTLLNLTSVFFREDDDTTVLADGFPVLNALKDVHLLLTEGQHNQYGDLPWTARQEMLIQEWLLSRPEMREFLPTRTMVAYPERWMGQVDCMKRLQGWSPDSVIHFRDLGQFGEQLLLSVRFGNWNAVIDRSQAAQWARYWRTEIQGYVHAYRSVTGVDLGVERTDARIDVTMPAIHLRRRLADQSGRRTVSGAESATAPAVGYTPRAQLSPQPVRQLPAAQPRVAFPGRPSSGAPAQLPPGAPSRPLPGRPEGR